jgi:hypothetical protein
MPLGVVTIFKSYRLIFTFWMFIDSNHTQVVDNSTAKRNISGRSSNLMLMQRKTRNIQSVKREPWEFRHSNRFEQVSEIIVNILRPILLCFPLIKVSILKNGVSWHFWVQIDFMVSKLVLTWEFRIIRYENPNGNNLIAS